MSAFDPGTLFLQLWFAHPEFDQSTFREVTLLDEKGSPLPTVAGGYTISGVEDAKPESDNLGWITYCLSPGTEKTIPSRLTVRLRYTCGALENVQNVVATDFDSAVFFENGSPLNGVGQDAKGRAFIAIAENTLKMKSRKFDAMAVTKDGRKLSPNGRSAAGAENSGLSVERFQFDVPLNDVANFAVGTRPIRTQEWKNVVLPPLGLSR